MIRLPSALRHHLDCRAANDGYIGFCSAIPQPGFGDHKLKVQKLTYFGNHGGCTGRSARH
jgi:hypothetical protein